jgi:hypothetical protein
MPIRFRYVAVSAAIGVVLVLASCDKSPTSPRPPEQGTPSTATTVRLELVAPPEIALGESVQLTANAVRTDGSVENVSSQAGWIVLQGATQLPPPSTILQLSSTGLATGRTRGEVLVRVNFGGLSANARIFVLPQGTFRLSGTIHENGVGLETATVNVISGIGEGLTAASNVSGIYVLYGVSGPVQILARKDGYLDASQQLDVTAHRDFSIEMVANRPRTDYTGTYTLTISAQPVCPPAFPDAARHRSFTARVKDNSGELFVTLSGGDFIVHNGYGNNIFGRVTSYGEARFYISEDFYYEGRGEFDIAERFGDTALLVRGEVSAKAMLDLISGALNGEILIAQGASPPFASYSSRCGADRFEMVRR